MQNFHNYDRTIDSESEESLSKIVNKIPEYSIVLDVGCSTGMLGRYLSEKKGCIVDGVDFDSAAVEISRPKYRFTAVKNLESETLTDVFKTEAYDYIVIADVIEHLISPNRLLSELKQLIKPNGTVIFSVPNITHIASSLELLLGNFDYRQNGLLDSTHLRFYSYKNLVATLNNAGLYIWETDVVRKDLGETEFGNEQSKLFPQKWLDTLIAVRPDSLVYQWIVATKIYPRLEQIESHPATKIITATPVFTTALYWEGSAGAGFNETNKLVGIKVSEIENELAIDFNFNLLPGQKINRIRIDPVSEKKVVWIKSAKIISNQTVVLWEWLGKEHPSDLTDAKWVETKINTGKIISAESDDPQWHPDIPDEALQNITSGAKLSMVMCVDNNVICSILSDTLMTARQSALENRESIASLNQAVIERDVHIANLNQAVTDRDGQNATLNQAVTDRYGQIATLNQAVTDRDGQIVTLNQALVDRDGHIADLSNIIKEIRDSTSWRVSAPLRYVTLLIRRVYSVLTVIPFIRKVRSIFSVLPEILQKGGGLWPTIRMTARVVRDEGLTGIKIRIRSFFADKAFSSVMDAVNESQFSIVPYYIDPRLDSAAAVCSTDVTIAVHLHLYYTEMLKEFAAYLNNIPVNYDLYVSIPKTADARAIYLELSSLLTKVGNIVVETVPNLGRDIAPLIIQFGKRLAQYEIIAHIHTKKSSHDTNLEDWCRDILNKLMGSPGSSGGRIAHIIELLQTTSKIVFPEGQSRFIRDRSSWADNYELAKHLLEKYTQFRIQDFPLVEFPEGSMFWARAECLKDFFELPLKYSDFPAEPIANDGTLAHALERLILIFASKSQGQCIRIHNGDSIQDFRHYEEQQDYSSSIIHSDIKVLSYYLPQFHPIPENDLWHGRDFTEWTKVKAANPLFDGHYQQHIPHPDIGYYLLDSPDVLRQQAELMHQSGVHGQVFYHYWFSGKLILEEPAKLLLNNPDIHMPFCFCWANENWTRRWDGNENEILLGQNYSFQDAHDFIHYLIPFFKDSRYIRVEDRPVLFVYRPSSIPNSQEYLDIWEKECALVGVKRPYVVAVLTRGASSPKDFGMDAGVERVLHDWTEGAVPEIKHTLHNYQPINGSVLPYNEVVNFYTGQKDAKDFTYFRSLVPIWDNTARYGSEAYLLHGSTPQRFQEWLESSIEYTQSTLPSDRRFVLVNAWNEWAEGAHLEPDSRFGYSYLNSVGRALSGKPYSVDINRSCSIPSGTKVHISIPSFILDKLNKDEYLKDRFIFCLSMSSIFSTCSVSISAPGLIKNLPIADQSGSGDADFILVFHQVALFDATVIEKMIQTAYLTGAAIIANAYDGNFPFIDMTENGSVQSFVAYKSPMLVLPKTTSKSGYKNFRMRTDARCIEVYPSELPSIEKPVVTTIIRFHKSADFNELKNALLCLNAMTDCVVIPLIAAQDLSSKQIEALENLLKTIPWTIGYEPQVHLYQSHEGNGDLRSKMLNESLKKVKTRYAAFLDFDDLLLPYAYGWLINRLKKTGKAVSFGRVYSTSYNATSGRLLSRARIYEYGNSYEEFVGLNHAPLHSFMLDMERFDLSHVVYFDDQRYMEDYLLTLQLFTKDNCDWDSLNENFFIGDYIHSLDREHTLAFSDEEDRKVVLANPEYVVCEQRICDMRKAVISRAVNVENSHES